MKIYYLGPEGTFSNEACTRFVLGMGEPEVSLVPVSSEQQVVESVLNSDDHSFGCVPLENSIQGSVTASWDALKRSAEPSVTMSSSGSFGESESMQIQIVAAYTMPIEQQLATLPETELGQVVEVMSHPQGLAQARKWLDEYLPDTRRTAVASTADAARLVREQADLTKAAVCPRAAADLYQLKIAANGIQEYRHNRTRFGLIAKCDLEVHQYEDLLGDDENRKLMSQLAFHPVRWTLAVVLEGVGNRPGGLLKALEPIHRCGYNLSRIESRPVGHQMGEYLFFLDLEWPHERRLPREVEDWQDVARSLAEDGIRLYQLGLFPELQ